MTEKLNADQIRSIVRHGEGQMAALADLAAQPDHQLKDVAVIYDDGTHLGVASSSSLQRCRCDRGEIRSAEMAS